MLHPRPHLCFGSLQLHGEFFDHAFRHGFRRAAAHGSARCPPRGLRCPSRDAPAPTAHPRRGGPSSRKTIGCPSWSGASRDRAPGVSFMEQPNEDSRESSMIPCDAGYITRFENATSGARSSAARTVERGTLIFSSVSSGGRSFKSRNVSTPRYHGRKQPMRSRAGRNAAR